MHTVPLDLLTPYGNRELATPLVQSATGQSPAAAHSIVLTLDATAKAVLQAAGVGAEESRRVLAALFHHPPRIQEPPALPSAVATSRQQELQFRRDLGQRIHVVRHARRLTPMGVQNRTAIKPYVLRDIENGDLWPSIPNLHRLARAFEVPLPLLVDPKATPLRVLRLLSRQVV